MRLEFKGRYLKQDKDNYTQGNGVNLFIVYELERWLQDLNTDFTLKDCLSGAVKLTKNADPDGYFYLVYGIGFDLVDYFHIRVLIAVKILFLE